MNWCHVYLFNPFIILAIRISETEHSIMIWSQKKLNSKETKTERQGITKQIYQHPSEWNYWNPQHK